MPTNTTRRESAVPGGGFVPWVDHHARLDQPALTEQIRRAADQKSDLVPME